MNSVNRINRGMRTVRFIPRQLLSALLLYLQHPCSRYRTLLHWMGHVGIFKIQHVVQCG